MFMRQTGTKLQKIVNDTVAILLNSPGLIMPVYLTMSTIPAVIMHEEAYQPNSINKSDTMFYDFFEKDHLGKQGWSSPMKNRRCVSRCYGREQCQLDDHAEKLLLDQYGRYHQYIQMPLGSDREQELCQQQWQSALQYRSVYYDDRNQ